MKLFCEYGDPLYDHSFYSKKELGLYPYYCILSYFNEYKNKCKDDIELEVEEIHNLHSMLSGDHYTIRFPCPDIYSQNDPKIERYILSPVRKWFDENDTFQHIDVFVCSGNWGKHAIEEWIDFFDRSKLNVSQRVYQRIRMRNIVNVFIRELYTRIYAPPNGKAYLRAKADFEVNTIHLNTFGR